MDAMQISAAAGREERLAWWRGHVEAQARSGQSAKAYCAEHGLKVWQWFYWRRALQPTTDGFMEVKPVRHGSLRLECAGCLIELTQGFDPALLREVIGALRAL